MKEHRIELTRAMTYILVTLVGQNLYGYAMISEIRQLLDLDTPGIGPATIYRSIYQLLNQNLIEKVPQVQPGDEDIRRSYYRITPTGREKLRAEIQRLDALLMEAHRRMATLPEPDLDGVS